MSELDKMFGGSPIKKIDKLVKEMIEHANNAGTEVEESNPLEKIPGFMGTEKGG
jgi:hypothetical protein